MTGCNHDNQRLLCAIGDKLRERERRGDLGSPQSGEEACGRKVTGGHACVCVGNVIKSQFSTHALALFINRVRSAVTSMNCPAGSPGVPGSARGPLYELTRVHFSSEAFVQNGTALESRS